MLDHSMGADQGAGPVDHQIAGWTPWRQAGHQKQARKRNRRHGDFSQPGTL